MWKDLKDDYIKKAKAKMFGEYDKFLDDPKKYELCATDMKKYENDKDKCLDPKTQDKLKNIKNNHNNYEKLRELGMNPFKYYKKLLPYDKNHSIDSVFEPLSLGDINGLFSTLNKGYSLTFDKIIDYDEKIFNDLLTKYDNFDIYVKEMRKLISDRENYMKKYGNVVDVIKLMNDIPKKYTIHVYKYINGSFIGVIRQLEYVPYSIAQCGGRFSDSEYVYVIFYVFTDNNDICDVLSTQYKNTKIPTMINKIKIDKFIKCVKYTDTSNNYDLKNISINNLYEKYDDETMDKKIKIYIDNGINVSDAKNIVNNNLSKKLSTIDTGYLAEKLFNIMYKHIYNIKNKYNVIHNGLHDLFMTRKLFFIKDDRFKFKTFTADPNEIYNNDDCFIKNEKIMNIINPNHKEKYKTCYTKSEMRKLLQLVGQKLTGKETTPELIEKINKKIKDSDNVNEYDYMYKTIGLIGLNNVTINDFKSFKITPKSKNKDCIVEEIDNDYSKCSDYNMILDRLEEIFTRSHLPQQIKIFRSTLLEFLEINDIYDYEPYKFASKTFINGYNIPDSYGKSYVFLGVKHLINGVQTVKYTTLLYFDGSISEKVYILSYDNNIDYVDEQISKKFNFKIKKIDPHGKLTKIIVKKGLTPKDDIYKTDEEFHKRIEKDNAGITAIHLLFTQIKTRRDDNADMDEFDDFDVDNINEDEDTVTKKIFDFEYMEKLQPLVLIYFVFYSIKNCHDIYDFVGKVSTYKLMKIRSYFYNSAHTCFDNYNQHDKEFFHYFYEHYYNEFMKNFIKAAREDSKKCHIPFGKSKISKVFDAYQDKLNKDDKLTELTDNIFMLRVLRLENLDGFLQNRGESTIFNDDNKMSMMELLETYSYEKSCQYILELILMDINKYTKYDLLLYNKLCNNKKIPIKNLKLYKIQRFKDVLNNLKIHGTTFAKVLYLNDIEKSPQINTDYYEYYMLNHITWKDDDATMKIDENYKFVNSYIDRYHNYLSLVILNNDNQKYNLNLSHIKTFDEFDKIYEISKYDYNRDNQYIKDINNRYTNEYSGCKTQFLKYNEYDDDEYDNTIKIENIESKKTDILDKRSLKKLNSSDLGKIYNSLIYIINITSKLQHKKVDKKAISELYEKIYNTMADGNDTSILSKLNKMDCMLASIIESCFNNKAYIEKIMKAKIPVPSIQDIFSGFGYLYYINAVNLKFTPKKTLSFVNKMNENDLLLINRLSDIDISGNKKTEPFKNLYTLKISLFTKMMRFIIDNEYNYVRNSKEIDKYEKNIRKSFKKSTYHKIIKEILNINYKTNYVSFIPSTNEKYKNYDDDIVTFIKYIIYMLNGGIDTEIENPKQESESESESKQESESESESKQESESENPKQESESENPKQESETGKFDKMRDILDDLSNHIKKILQEDNSKKMLGDLLLSVYKKFESNDLVKKIYTEISPYTLLEQYTVGKIMKSTFGLKDFHENCFNYFNINYISQNHGMHILGESVPIMIYKIYAYYKNFNPTQLVDFANTLTKLDFELYNELCTIRGEHGPLPSEISHIRYVHGAIFRQILDMKSIKDDKKHEKYMKYRKTKIWKQIYSQIFDDSSNISIKFKYLKNIEFKEYRTSWSDFSLYVENLYDKLPK